MVLPQIPEDEKNTESAAAVEIGGTRYVIKGYSKASRRRQLRAMSKVKRSALKRNPGIFLTLTYPGFGAGEDWRDWKYHMKKFAERFKYNFPTATATWRMELVERKSGAAAGKLVPHFHLLAFAVPLDKIRQRHKLDYAGSLQWFRDWAAKAWWKCVGSGDETHLRAGTSVEIIRNWRKVMAYTSKYIAKTTDDIDGTLMEVGRWWGIINKAAWAEISVADDAVRRIALTRRNGLKMWAWARAFVGIPDDAGYRLPSVHFFVDSDWLLDNWESIVNGEYAVTAAVPPSMTDDYGG